MDSENVKVSDAKVQSLGLKFTFSTEGDKLIVEALCSKDNQKYVGKIIANHYIVLQDIKELLNGGQYKTLFKKQEILKIKVGYVSFILLPKQKSEINKIDQPLTKQANNQIYQDYSQIKKIEQEKEKKRIKSSFKWSEQLKSDKIKINGNIATLTSQFKYQLEFCLLNVSFSNTLKQKQSWAFKINKDTGTVQLGVCLKSKILEYNFNSRNMNWRKTGHGLYKVGTYGICFSHSQEDFNRAQKCFRFAATDAIWIEYDPIDKMLRFILNKNEDCFEMPIITPPQNDEYYPFVAIRGQNSQVELIYHTQINKLQSRNSIYNKIKICKQLLTQ